MENYNFDCEVCNNKGWLKTVTLGSQFIRDNTEVIEKCDECCLFLNDFEAAQYAYAQEKVITLRDNSGFNVLIKSSEN